MIFFGIRSAKQNPEISRVIFFEKKLYSQGAISKSQIFKKHPYWWKMTTRGNLATLVRIIMVGCSDAYIGRIINAKILLGIMI